MTQRFHQKNSNEGIVCEKYLARLLNKDKQTAVALSHLTRSRDKSVKGIFPNTQNQLVKTRPNVKQQNLPSPYKKGSTRNVHSDDSALVELTVKTMNSRQRSRSTTADRESWGQVLKQHKIGDKISIFGNFDPLRTLHFLAKELQFQLQSVLPDDTTIQQMVADMQYALKRVPPEVASTVHLQQAIDILPRKSSSKCCFDKPEKLRVNLVDCGVQTMPSKTFEDNDKLQQIMEEGTSKLENSCLHMEKLCTDLKNEKNKLEKELIEYKKTNKILNNKISDLELENNEILAPRLKALEDEKRKLESQLKSIVTKLETVSQHSFNDLKSQITELKSQKNSLEQECNNMKHKIKVCALEREKFIAVLSLRDAQINEIRSEMSHLQEVVNEQLLELHNNAYFNIQSLTNNKEALNFERDKTNQAVDAAFTSPRDEAGYFTPKQTISFKDLASGDIDISNFAADDGGTDQKQTGNNLPPISLGLIDKLDSQTSIRTMFDQVKRTAYAVAGNAKGGS